MQWLEELTWFHALKNKQYNEIREKLSHDPLLIKTKLGPQQQVPLAIAAQNNDDVLINILLEIDADEGLIWEAMHASIIHESMDALNVFFALPQLTKIIARLDSMGMSLIHHAAINGRQQVLQRFKSKGYNIGLPIDNPNSSNHDKNSLQLAIESNHEACALFLYTNGVIFDGLTHLAAQKGRLSLLKAVADKGGNLNVRDQAELTPLVWAVHAGQTKVVEYLLSKKEVDINNFVQNDYKSHHRPIFWAVVKGHTAIVEKLLDAGADITFLCHTYFDERASTVSKGSLFEYKTNGSGRVVAANGALIFAALAMTGITPFWFMVPGYFLGPVSCHVNDFDKYTLLHIAAIEGYLEIVKLLVTKSPPEFQSQRDYWGQSASQLAQKAGHIAIVNYLRGTSEPVVEPQTRFSSQPHYFGRSPSFYQSSDRVVYTPDKTLRDNVRLFSDKEQQRVVVESYVGPEGTFSEQASLMPQAYLGQYRTFYFKGCRKTQEEGTVRFVRPYFQGEPANLYLKKQNDVEEILKTLQAITNELKRLHADEIVLNKMELKTIILLKKRGRYQVVFSDFSKSMRKSVVESLSTFFPQNTTNDIRLYAKVLNQFLYDHPQGVEIATKMPSLMHFIQADLNQDATISTIFKDLNLLPLSTDWVDQDNVEMRI